MAMTRVTDKLSVMPQPDLEEFKLFADQGYTTLVNARPDGRNQLNRERPPKKMLRSMRI